MGREEDTHPVLYFCWVENGGVQLLAILLAVGLRKRWMHLTWRLCWSLIWSLW